MPDALIITYVELPSGKGRVYKAGSLQQKRHAVTADNVLDALREVAGSGSGSPVVTLWSALVDLPASFALLVLETDQPVMIELVTDENNSVGEAIYTFELNPSTPLILGDDASYANHTVGFGGTLDTIETVKAKNLGATDANVRVLVVD